MSLNRDCTVITYVLFLVLTAAGVGLNLKTLEKLTLFKRPWGLATQPRVQFIAVDCGDKLDILVFTFFFSHLQNSMRINLFQIRFILVPEEFFAMSSAQKVIEHMIGLTFLLQNML